MSGISRRQALAGLGSISVGALIAACSDDDDSSALDPETNTGTIAEVEPKTSSGDLASQFDDAAACRQTAEETEGPFYFDVDRVLRFRGRTRVTVVITPTGPRPLRRSVSVVRARG